MSASLLAPRNAVWSQTALPAAHSGNPFPEGFRVPPDWAAYVSDGLCDACELHAHELCRESGCECGHGMPWPAPSPWAALFLFRVIVTHGCQCHQEGRNP